MAEHTYLLSLDHTCISYQIRRSRRRRRTIEVTVDRLGGVCVSAPMRVSRSSIEDLLARRSGWITRQVEVQKQRSAEPPREYATGDSVPFLGRALPLIIREAGAARATVRPLIGALEITLGHASGPDRRSAIMAALERWYRAEAEADFEGRVARYASLVEAAPPSVVVRAQKHLWGSCSPSGVLRFNWRLIMAPPALVDYVVVHELCHLRHPHHQKPFWDAVAAILPDYQARRAELRRDGDSYRL